MVNEFISIMDGLIFNMTLPTAVYYHSRRYTGQMILDMDIGTATTARHMHAIRVAEYQRLVATDRRPWR